MHIVQLIVLSSEGGLVLLMVRYQSVPEVLLPRQTSQTHVSAVNDA